MFQLLCRLTSRALSVRFEYHNSGKIVVRGHASCLSRNCQKQRARRNRISAALALFISKQTSKETSPGLASFVRPIPVNCVGANLTFRTGRSHTAGKIVFSQAVMVVNDLQRPAQPKDSGKGLILGVHGGRDVHQSDQTAVRFLSSHGLRCGVLSWDARALFRIFNPHRTVQTLSEKFGLRTSSANSANWNKIFQSSERSLDFQSQTHLT